MTPRQIPVLIVGAGPVGLVFAAEMARYGIEARIIDKSEGTKEISKALILHVRTQEVLDAMGISQELQAEANPLRRVEIIGYGKHLGHGWLDGVNSPYRHPVILGQNVTERVLQQHLNRLGVQVEWQTEATGLTQDAEGVTVTLRGPNGQEEIVHASYVLGADGTHSLVRERAGLEFVGERYEGQAFIQSDSKIRWPLPAGSSYLWFTEQGYMMVIEMPNGIVRTFISVPDTDPAKRNATLSEVNEALNRLGGIDAELYDPVWVALYRVNHRVAPAFRSSRVFIAGDAAHEHVPIGGQGMNTSIQDAFNLAWKLAYVIKGRTHPDLLDTYNMERHPVAESLLAGTDQAYTRILAANDLAKYAVRTLGPVLLASETVRNKMREVLEEIGINYRSGPLSTDCGDGSEPQAGDRALDATVVNLPDRKSTALRDFFRGGHWTLLAFSGHDERVNEFERLSALHQQVEQRYRHAVKGYFIAGGFPVRSERPGILLDPFLQAHAQYGVTTPSLFLIRPDWYIAFRGKARHSKELEENLGRYLQSSTS
jgi:2-polyprenyl-6-methoxyphenol hydroxylase-like FAD-dependent oxidoreductase